MARTMIPFGIPAAGQPPERDQLPEIRAGLRAGIDALARRLLGEPVRGGRNARILKFGSRSGSLQVQISGSKQGLWYDHALCVGGDALALIQHVNGGPFADAVAWAAGWLGIDIGKAVPKSDRARATEQAADRQRKRAEAAAQEAKDAARRVNLARRWWSSRKPLTGTVGAQYLADRGIAHPAGGWPDCVAFLPASRVTFEDQNAKGLGVRRTIPCAGAVIFAATRTDGEVCGTQRIYLDHDARNIRDSTGRKVKITNGVLRGNGAVVRLPRRAQ
jgi:hypothetical protein